MLPKDTDIDSSLTYVNKIQGNFGKFILLSRVTLKQRQTSNNGVCFARGFK